MAVSAQFTREEVVSLFQQRRPTALRGLHSSRHSNRYVDVHASAGDPSSSTTKRAMDVLIASMALVFLMPLLIGISIAIKATSPGPVFFKQRRYGLRNRQFQIYKFRTMDVETGDQSGVRQTTSNDPRVTPIGRFLRRTSLDELPQLLNVVIGDMSIVGPRPHVPGMQAGARLYEDLVPYYFHRHTVRPGITGLAQVSGCRGSTVNRDSAMDRIDYDLQYIETWPIWLDIKIIAKTARQEFLSGNGF